MTSDATPAEPPAGPPAERPAHAPPAPAAEPRAGWRIEGEGDGPVILVAEDEESVRGMVSLVLRGRGYRVLLCSDGGEAVEQIDAGAPVDAALVDIRMPRLGGVEVVRHIRTASPRPRLPVVAMSAYNDEVQAREVLGAGADVFLAKPFTVTDLASTLAALLDGREA